MKIDPSGNIYLIGLYSLFRSSNEGDTWELSNGEIDISDFLYDMAFDAYGSAFVAGSTVFRSTDGGHYWSRSGSGLPIMSELNFIVVSMLATPEGRVLIGTIDAGAFYSDSHREVWSRFGVGITSQYLKCLEPGREGRLWTGGSNGWLYYTDDHGIGWHCTKARPDPNGVYSITVNPLHGAIWVGTNHGGVNGVFFSSDNGDSWVRNLWYSVSGRNALRATPSGKLYLNIVAPTELAVWNLYSTDQGDLWWLAGKYAGGLYSNGDDVYLATKLGLLKYDESDSLLYEDSCGVRNAKTISTMH